MANVPFPVPDSGTPLSILLGKALAKHLGKPDPTTDAERVALCREFWKTQAREVTLNYRAQEAATNSRSDDSDGLLSW